MLAVGIAANVLAFEVLDKLMLSQPPLVREPSAVARVYVSYHDQANSPRLSDVVSYVDVRDLSLDTRDFQSVTAYFPVTVASAEHGAAQAAFVAPNYFLTLGVAPARGRFFDAASGPASVYLPEVVLSYEAWQKWFGGAPTVVGRLVHFNRQPLRIVGIAPKEFRGLDYANVDCWVPIGAMAASFVGYNWDVDFVKRWLHVIARMRRGMPYALAAKNASERLFGVPSEKSLAAVMPSLVLGPLIAARGPAGVEAARLSTLLLGVSSVLLLIACANVANLLLARALSRRREIAIRLALGATKFSLFRQFAVESMVLTGLALAAAIVLTLTVGGLVRHILLPSTLLQTSILSPHVSLYACLVGAGVSFGTGLFPAIHARKFVRFADLSSTTSDLVTARLRMRFVLIGVQVAFTVVLLFGATLFRVSLHNASSMDLGMRADRVIVARSRAGNMTTAARPIEDGYRRAAARIAQLADVQLTAVANTIPFAANSGARISLPSRDSIYELPGSAASLSAVTSNFFAALGMQVRSGFLDRNWDGSDADQVAVINSLLADVLWPGETAVGKCIVVAGGGDSCRRVVAVVDDARQVSIRQFPVPQVFIPFGQFRADLGTPALFVRTLHDPAKIVGVVQHELERALPQLPFVEARPLAELIVPQMRSWLLGSSLLGAFAAIAAVIAGFGIVSVSTFLVAQRRDEFAIRMALGARATAIAGIAIRQVIWATVAGLAVGLLLSWICGPVVSPLLLGIDGRDPRAFVTVVMQLLPTVLIGCLIPAWVGSRVSPAAALRTS
jgi:predicted permease